MLSIDSARRLVDGHSKTASTYFREDQTVITSTTTHDDTLRNLSWHGELDIVRRFGSDYHIPTEYSVYDSTMSVETQAESIADCLQGVEWMSNRLANHSTEVLVPAKGWLPWHFELCRPTMERLETSFLVFYATGYGPRKNELREHLASLVSVLEPSGILLIGKQAPRFLSIAPPEVVATAGRRWGRKSGLEEEGHRPTKHSSWKMSIENELASGQAVLNSFGSNRVKENG
jgi:hypothetical protein